MKVNILCVNLFKLSFFSLTDLYLQNNIPIHGITVKKLTLEKTGPLPQYGTYISRILPEYF